MDIKTCAGFEYIFVPSKTTSPLTLLLLHGTGGTEESLLPLAQQIAPTANIVSVRGPILEGTCRRFFARVSEGVFDESEVIQRAMSLAIFSHSVADAHSLSSTNIIALGFSNGANIAAAMTLTQNTNLAGAILLRAMPTLASNSHILQTKIPILLLSGAHDELVPDKQAGILAQQLENAGALVQHTFVSSGHTLTETDLLETKAWLATNFSL